MRSIIKTYLVTIIGVTGAIAGLIGFNLKFLSKLLPETQLAVVFIGVFACYFFIVHVATRARWERKSRYADALDRLNIGFEEIHHLSRCDTNISKEQLIEGFQTMCDSLTEIFSQLTNSKCSTCIKIIKSSSSKKLTFETLCRNKRADKERKSSDLQTKSKKVRHTLDDNTSFSQALHSTRGYYLSNRLPLLNKYKNTSFQVYGEPNLGWNLIMRLRKWPLPYKSTVVVPITPSKVTEEKKELIGFLCVDSSKFGVFQSEYDVHILQGTADGIYNTLKKFKSII